MSVFVLIAVVTLVDGPTETHVRSRSEPSDAFVEELGRGVQRVGRADDVDVPAHGAERRVPVAAGTGTFVTEGADIQIRLGVRVVAR
jgi:hypothetical protein